MKYIIHIVWEKQNIPETGTRYSTVAKFVNQTENWSVILEIMENTGEKESTALAYFLSTEAPEKLLVTGARFQLIEGSRVVGDVEVIRVQD